MEQKLQERFRNNKKTIKKITQIIKRLPDGRLSCQKNRKYIKWYHVHENVWDYIQKKDRQFAEKLAYKTFLQSQLEDLKNEQEAIEAYLNKRKKRSNPEQILSDSNYADLLKNILKPKDQELRDWANEDYSRNPHYPENLKYSTVAGIQVRSKSEVDIVTALYLHKIPFRYECALNISGGTIFPDFTIRHPKTGEIFYWEHLGMLDHPGYVSKNMNKIGMYINNGIIPTKNLILTFETKDQPLTYDMIEKVIEEYFL